MALSPEERTLISRAIRRDREAFAQLYVQYHGAVLRRVLQIVNRRDEAEDITGETFLRAWNAVDRFQERDVSILAWLCKIGERRALEYLRKNRPVVGLEEISLQASQDESPEDIAERKAAAAEVRRALHKLPKAQREVLSQRFLNDLGYDEVAESLGKPAGTIRVIQHRALAALRLIIKEERSNRARSRPSTGAIK